MDITCVLIALLALVMVVIDYRQSKLGPAAWLWGRALPVVFSSALMLLHFLSLIMLVFYVAACFYLDIPARIMAWGAGFCVLALGVMGGVFVAILRLAKRIGLQVDVDFRLCLLCGLAKRLAGQRGA